MIAWRATYSAPRKRRISASRGSGLMAAVFCVADLGRARPSGYYVSMADDSEMVRFFQRHVVPVQFDFTHEGKKHHAAISTFLISVRDQWLLVTAGHCIRNIENTLATGAKLDSVWLIDCMG